MTTRKPAKFSAPLSAACYARTECPNYHVRAELAVPQMGTRAQRPQYEAFLAASAYRLAAEITIQNVAVGAQIGLDVDARFDPLRDRSGPASRSELWHP